MSELTIIGLQSLVASLRHELAQVTAERDRLFNSRPGPRPKPLLDIGARRDGAVITGHQGGLHILRCGCGTIFKRGRTALVSDTPWRCSGCRKDHARQNALDTMSRRI